VGGVDPDGLYSYSNNGYNGYKPPKTEDQTRLLSICSRLNNTCSGCSLDACNNAVRQLMSAARTTWVLNLFGWYIGPDTCERWAFEFERNLPPSFGFMNCCIRESSIQTWDTEMLLSPRHAAYRVKFCDGTEFYFDNGGLGLNDHIFTADDVPQGW
jgi:hypothetical protein